MALSFIEVSSVRSVKIFTSTFSLVLPASSDTICTFPILASAFMTFATLFAVFLTTATVAFAEDSLSLYNNTAFSFSSSRKEIATWKAVSKAKMTANVINSAFTTLLSRSTCCKPPKAVISISKTKNKLTTPRVTDMILSNTFFMSFCLRFFCLLSISPAIAISKRLNNFFIPLITHFLPSFPNRNAPLLY